MFKIQIGKKSPTYAPNISRILTKTELTHKHVKISQGNNAQPPEQ